MTKNSIIFLLLAFGLSIAIHCGIFLRAGHSLDTLMYQIESEQSQSRDQARHYELSFVRYKRAVQRESPEKVATSQEQGQSGTKLDDYRLKLLTKLKQNLVYPEAAKERGEKGSVCVSFMLDQSGRLSGSVSLVKSSSYSLLDRAALRSVYKSSPFGALPESVVSPTQNFKATLHFVLE